MLSIAKNIYGANGSIICLLYFILFIVIPSQNLLSQIQYQCTEQLIKAEIGQVILWSVYI